MKKKIIVFHLVMFISLNNSFAQLGAKWDLGGNVPNAGSYLGSTNAQPLLLKTEVSGQPINFYTAAQAGTFLNGRMTIKGNYFNTQGLIGIGDMGTNCTFQPQSQLHQHRNYNNSMYHQFTNDNTGITLLDGFRIGLTYTAPVTWVDLMQQEDAPIRISTGNNNIAPSQMLERMRFTTGFGGDNSGGWNNAANATKITISSEGFTTLPFANPVASLNIGNDGNGTQSGGRRIWMDIGTFYSSNSDHMYTGLMDMGQNMKDAIINFGDDPQYNPLDASVQNLRFIFTQYNFGGPITDPHNPSGTQGLEIARMNAQGNMGIGPLFTNTMQPSRRLEIVDDGLTHVGRIGGPQLRLTHITSQCGQYPHYRCLDRYANNKCRKFVYTSYKYRCE